MSRSVVPVLPIASPGQVRRAIVDHVNACCRSCETSTEAVAATLDPTGSREASAGSPNGSNQAGPGCNMPQTSHANGTAAEPAAIDQPAGVVGEQQPVQPPEPEPQATAERVRAQPINCPCNSERHSARAGVAPHGWQDYAHQGYMPVQRLSYRGHQSNSCTTLRSHSAML